MYIFAMYVCVFVCACVRSCMCSLQTSVFTPAFGSVTNVRVNSSMTTLQVLNLLLQKFRVSYTHMFLHTLTQYTHTSFSDVIVMFLTVCVSRLRIKQMSLFSTWSTSLVVSDHISFLCAVCVFMRGYVWKSIFMCSVRVCMCVAERTPLKDSEYPLVYRVLHGPCEKISKIFIMETDLGEEVTHDVSLHSLSLSLSLFHTVCVF